MTLTAEIPVSAPERVAHLIRQDIEAGRLAHAALLPATKVLAEQYDASATTITKAMDILKVEGKVLVKDRSGRVVNYPPAAAATGAAAKPVVLLIGGYAGSGKTELGRIISRRTHWAMLDKDSTTRSVVEAALTTMGLSPHDRESEQYRTIIRPAEYEALMTGTIENVECGTSCVVTAPFVAEFSDPAWCARTRSSIESRGGIAVFIWVECDAETMFGYVRKRGAARDASKLADWPAWLAQLDLAFRPATEHTVINNSAADEPLEGQAAALLATVNTTTATPVSAGT
ncbi:GntR family transcriptional regulator [Pseudonocardiaceae bacterium YIM PH 21723]|nr:GntR family transcriptional regulator [Pseudonocardiaceae bacterium YIM PH 21723]